MNAGKVDLLLILGGNPVYTAPADLEFADALAKVAASRPPEPLRRRDVGAVPLADSRGALPRGVERRARLRRHRLDRPAAHRAALRRQVGARGAGRDERSAGAVGVRHRPSSGATMAVVASAVRPDSRRRSSSVRGGAGCTTASCRTRRSRAKVGDRHRIRNRIIRIRNPRRQRRASRSPSATTRRSSTAASPTTAGCRSCRSRSRS